MPETVKRSQFHAVTHKRIGLIGTEDMPIYWGTLTDECCVSDVWVDEDESEW